MSAALMVQDVIHGPLRSGFRDALDEACGIPSNGHARTDMARDNDRAGEQPVAWMVWPEHPHVAAQAEVAA